MLINGVCILVYSFNQWDERRLAHVFSRPGRCLSKSFATSSATLLEQTNSQSAVGSGSRDQNGGLGLDTEDHNDDHVFISNDVNDMKSSGAGTNTDANNCVNELKTQNATSANILDPPAPVKPASLTNQVNGVSKSPSKSSLPTTTTTPTTSPANIIITKIQAIRKWSRKLSLQNLSTPNNLNILMRFGSKIIRPQMSSKGNVDSLPGSFSFTVERSEEQKPVATQGIHFGLPSALFAVPAVAKQR
jgi:hypothetical protein